MQIWIPLEKLHTGASFHYYYTKVYTVYDCPLAANRVLRILPNACYFEAQISIQFCLLYMNVRLYDCPLRRLSSYRNVCPTFIHAKPEPGRTKLDRF